MKELLQQASNSQTINQQLQIQYQQKLQRKLRIQKNRAIRKNKVSRQLENQQPPPIPSKEDKLQIQKLRNREAAQKSREHKKLYVKGLQEENRQLKQLIKRQVLCERCKNEINSTNTDKNQQVNDDISLNEQNDSDSLFIRLPNEQGSHIGLYLMITMIAICIFTYNGIGLQQTSIELYKQDTISFSQCHQPFDDQDYEFYVDEARYSQQARMKYMKSPIINKLQDDINKSKQASSISNTKILVISFKNCENTFIEYNKYYEQMIQKINKKMMEKDKNVKHDGKNQSIRMR